MKVEGIFKGLNNEKEYAGKYYGKLLDPSDGETSLTIKIPKSLLPEFVGKEEGFFRVVGTPYWDVKPKNGKGEVVLDVKEIDGVEIEHLKIDEKAKVITEKIEKGRRDPEKLLRNRIKAGEKPSVAIIIGEAAIVDEDIRRALDVELREYDLEFVRTNLTDKEALTEALLKADTEGYDLIALVRGGGSGLEIFDDVELARVCLELDTPFVTALGHARNLHLLDAIADRYFTTPTDLGTFLADVVKSISEIERLKNKVAELEREREKQNKEIQALIEERAKVSTEKKNLEEKVRELERKIDDQRREAERERTFLQQQFQEIKSREVSDNLRLAEELNRLKRELKEVKPQLEHLSKREKIYIVVIFILLLLIVGTFLFN